MRIGQEIQYHLKARVGISPQGGYGVGQVLRWHQAATHARAVIAVVGEAVSSGELTDVKTELAPDYDALFEEAT